MQSTEIISINAITEKMEKLGDHTFGFHFTSYEKTVKGFDNLKSRKVSQETDISVKIAKEIKKDDKSDKENCRPTSILPNLSIVYERLMYGQICLYFHTIFSKFQCGF